MSFIFKLNSSYFHFFFTFFLLQRLFPVLTTCIRNISSDSADLKGILADKIPKEQERVKNFRKAHGATKVGEVTVEMVSTRVYDCN